MSELISVMRDALTILAVLFVLCVMVYHLWRDQKTRQATPSHPQPDLTHTMILFQTMRDILDQQKDLARQVNESLDKKVGIIKQTVNGALDDLERLREATRKLRLELEEARSELESVQKQVGFLKDRPSPAATERKPEVEYHAHPPRAPKPSAPESERPALHVLARPPETGSPGDILDAWVGLDFANDTADSVEFEPIAPAPEAPEDPEAARKAFRALLNLGAEDPRSTREVSTPGTALERPGNGKVTPMQARVYEYSDAGMSVPQIARE
ncbi:MAG: hypothetical protein HY706_18805, partial [Candidatus Hydrogenedentes bacterium]|nr:hypothetical protein [Candidatus Hydrogenedentota bacterium]